MIGCVKLGFYFYLPFVFIFLSCIGKFGLFPSSFGILPIVDGMSLFSISILMLLNKYIYLILLYYFTKSLQYDTASLMVILGFITIYHSISLNVKGFTLRKFIASSSMISFGVILIQLIYTYLGFFQLFFYLGVSFGLFGIMKVDCYLVFSQ